MKHRIPTQLAFVFVLVLGGCSNPTSYVEPDPGTIPDSVPDTPDPAAISISVSTTGQAPAGGYTATVDDITYAIAPNGSITVQVSTAADHSVRLQVGDKCLTVNPDRQVPGGQSAHYDVTCGSYGVGILHISVSTTGIPRDDHYRLYRNEFDIGEALYSIEPNGTMRRPALGGPRLPHLLCP